MRVVCVCMTCTQPALKHDMSIQTLHSAKLPSPCPLFPQFLLSPDTAREGGHPLFGAAHTREGHVHHGVDPRRKQVAKCASGAGPDLGPFHPKCISTVPDLGFCKMQKGNMIQGPYRGSLFDMKPELTDPLHNLIAGSKLCLWRPARRSWRRRQFIPWTSRTH